MLVPDYSQIETEIVRHECLHCGCIENRKVQEGVFQCVACQTFVTDLDKHEGPVIEHNIYKGQHSFKVIGRDRKSVFAAATKIAYNKGLRNYVTHRIRTVQEDK